MCIRPERDANGRLVRGTANPAGASVPRARLARLLAQAEKLNATITITLPARLASDDTPPTPTSAA